MTATPETAGAAAWPALRSRWRLDERRAVLLATALSALLHLLMAGSLPLIITPDGGEYIRSALGAAGAPWSEPNRTPGYPMLLAATFALFGVGAGGILIVQNALAVASCALLTYAACRLAGPGRGLAIGVLYALEPWSLALANYALTETATVFCVLVAVAASLAPARHRVLAAAGLGLALGAACLVRPAIPSLAVFIAGAWLAGLSAGLRERARLAAVIALALLLVVGPWLAYNASRGVRGLASGSDWVLWYGVTMFGLLDRTHPVDPAMRAVVDRNLAGGIGDYPVMRTVLDLGALESREQGERLGDWAIASIRARPLAYVASVPYALLWQLNAGIEGKPPMYDELPFFLDRLSWDAHQPPRGASPNFQNPGALPKPWAFTMAWHGGVVQAYLRAAQRLHGIPQLPLFACAVIAGVLAAVRRDAQVALLLGGSVAFVLVHAALLLPIARHAMPVWTIWYLAAAYLLGGGAGARTNSSWSRIPAARSVASIGSAQV